MANGHWIEWVDVRDPEAHQPHLAAVAGPFAGYGARLVIRGGATEVVEGAARERSDR